MRALVWGAGNIGTSLVERLSEDAVISSVYWMNRSPTHKARAEDIRQSLALAPSCREIIAGSQSDPGFSERALVSADIVILTAGAPLTGDKFDRSALYDGNCEQFHDPGNPASICALLRRYKPRFLLVVSNPVDLLTRFLFRECDLEDTAVAGLGTVVETMRLRAEISRYCSGEGVQVLAREVASYAIGTHDKCFVPVFLDRFGDLQLRDEATWRAICACAAENVRYAPEKVRKRLATGGVSTLVSIVGSILAVTRALLVDSHATFTVSVHDRATPDALFYSLPCVLGRSGILKFGSQPKHAAEVAALNSAKEGLRKIINRR